MANLGIISWESPLVANWSNLAWEHPVIVNFVWQLGLEATLMVIIGNLVQEYRLVASLGN